jgi:hypothetical protein
LIYISWRGRLHYHSWGRIIGRIGVVRPIIEFRPKKRGSQKKLKLTIITVTGPLKMFSSNMTSFENTSVSIASIPSQSLPARKQRNKDHECN